MGLYDSFGRNRNNLSIDPVHIGLAIDRRNTSHQLGGLGHVPSTPWMNYQLRIRERLHHAACTTRMIEMNMRQYDVVDRSSIQPEPFQRCLRISK